MGLETGNFIDDLNPDFPLGTDPVAEGDDHLRLIKRCLKGNVAGDTLGTQLLASAVAALGVTGTGSQTTGQATASDAAPAGVDDLTRKDYVDGEVLTLQGQIDGLQTQIDNILNGTTAFTGVVSGTDWNATGI